MLSEIGSNFWLTPGRQYKDIPIGTPEQFNCSGSDYIWLSTGRSAIKLVIETIEACTPGLKKVAVLPSFTCDTVFKPFLRLGYEVYYYPVEKDLTTTSEAVMKTAMEHDASIVLFHRYFGFDTLDSQIDKMCEVLRGLNKYTVEDCTQCLYSNIPRARADFTVGSIRKWTGTPDGGFAICREGTFDNKPICSDKTLEQAKIKASYAKYRYLFEHEGGKGEMLAMYREAEDILDRQVDIYAISDTSVKVQANLDKAELVSIRRENFDLLRRSLEGQFEPIFTINKEEEVPLYFPILVDDRIALQKHLVSNAIYAPVVWPKDKNQPMQCDGAENAYQHLLCIPIDQRYDSDDMKRIIKVINSYYSK